MTSKRSREPRVFEPVDLGRVRTVPLSGRHSKVDLKKAGETWTPGGSFDRFWRGLPDYLGAKDLGEVVARVRDAVRTGGVVALGMGAHPIKVGLSPILCDLMRRGVVHALAVNGAAIVHDYEIATLGRTSEEVAEELRAGTFGMAAETARDLNDAIREGVARGWGIGRAVGERLRGAAHASVSLFATAAELGIPATVHVALGTDIIHMHPSADGAAIGEGSMRDFRLFAGVVRRLRGGVYWNLGSAVLMPEVFLKALSVATNLGDDLRPFTTVNFDMLRHYRPALNVVGRPEVVGAKGYAITGHHEILVPLLAAAVLEELDKDA
ncbi:MAG: hypothetical protein KC466_15600 [Myxococcales bacterium]|nr:hypothetical protein [Myxococcales bacterium]